MSDWEDFTVENNIYKGKVSSYTFNYKSLGEILWTKIKSHRDQIAHLDVCTEQVVTYAELQDKVVRCALWLQEQGIKAGDVVSLCTHDHLNSFVPCLAAAYINAIFNPWVEEIDLQIAVYFMQLTTPKVIFCNEKSVNIILNAKIESNCNPIVVVFGEHLDVIAFSDILRMYSDAEVTNFRYVELDDIKKTACILFSSGTMGMPKGVELSNYSLLLIYYNKRQMNVFNKAELLWFSSLHWLSGTEMNLTAILYGKKMILYPEFNEEVTCQLIEKYKVRNKWRR